MSTSIPESDITLRDGRAVHVRAMRPTDEAELLQVFHRTSDDARYMRFMRVVREPNLERLRKTLATYPDGGIGLVATIPADDGIDIVGSAIAIIESEPGHCEFAINVDAAFGGAGLATALMKTLIDAARRRSLTVMEGWMSGQVGRCVAQAKPAPGFAAPGSVG